MNSGDADMCASSRFQCELDKSSNLGAVETNMEGVHSIQCVEDNPRADTTVFAGCVLPHTFGMPTSCAVAKCRTKKLTSCDIARARGIHKKINQC